MTNLSIRDIKRASLRQQRKNSKQQPKSKIKVLQKLRELSKSVMDSNRNFNLEASRQKEKRNPITSVQFNSFKDPYVESFDQK